MIIDFLYKTTSLYILNSRIFCTAVATVISFLLSILLLPPYIKLLKNFQLTSELEGNGRHRDPVMPAGILFLIVVCITTIITVRINSYVFYGLIIYVFFSIIGAIDDIAKVINKRRVLQGKLSKQNYQYKADGISSTVRLCLYLLISGLVAIFSYKYIPNISGHLSIPFFSIAKIFPYLPFWLFIPLMTLTIAVLANGVNFTDGIDTLATVPSITNLIFLGIVSFVSSNSNWSHYLLIPHIYGLQELLPLIGAVCGTLLAFLWFNSPPSAIIMGDSGAVGLGGFIGILFIFTKTVFFLPVVGFIFIMEFISVIIQIGYFKLTKKRIFLMAPIHHHFQIKMQKNGNYGNIFEIRSKILWRFHIISVIMLVLGLALFLKVR